jgi:hypothetical protein
MGSFDSFLFVTTPDGRTVYFPFFPICWRGYVIGSNAELVRVRLLSALLMPFCMPTVFLLAALPRGIAGLAMLALTVFYLVWMRWVLHGLNQPPVRLTRRESAIVQVRAHGQNALAGRMFGSIGFVGLGALLILIDHNNWPIAAVTILVFGVCGVSYAALLVARWRMLSEHSPCDAA